MIYVRKATVEVYTHTHTYTHTCIITYVPYHFTNISECICTTVRVLFRATQVSFPEEYEV